MKKSIFIVIVVIVIAAIIVFIPKKSDVPRTNINTHTYSVEKYGIAFSYPQDYVLTEAERGAGERGHYNITLIKKEDSNIPENGEGPTAITFDIFQNNIDKQSLDNWFHNASVSNAKLTAAHSYASSTVAGKEAITYRWSGLYEGESTAFAHKDNIVMVSVTYMSPEDKNIQTYRDIMESITLLSPKTLSESEAVAAVKRVNPGLMSYPSDNLPPKRIQAELVQDGSWRLGFLSLGSGRPGILLAECYSVSPSGTVTNTGEFKAGTTTVEKLNLMTCKAQ